MVTPSLPESKPAIFMPELELHAPCIAPLSMVQCVRMLPSLHHHTFRCLRVYIAVAVLRGCAQKKLVEHTKVDILRCWKHSMFDCCRIGCICTSFELNAT